MKCPLWFRLSVAFGVDVAITMSWRQDGRCIKADADVQSAQLALKLDLPVVGSQTAHLRRVEEYYFLSTLNIRISESVNNSALWFDG